MTRGCISGINSVKKMMVVVVGKEVDGSYDEAEIGLKQKG